MVLVCGACVVLVGGACVVPGACVRCLCVVLMCRCLCVVLVCRAWCLCVVLVCGACVCRLCVSADHGVLVESPTKISNFQK